MGRKSKRDRQRRRNEEDIPRPDFFSSAEPIKKKIDAVLAMDRPKNKTEKRSFMGAVNFYKSLSPRRTHRALAPLTEATGDGPKRWTDEHQKAFDKMKALIEGDYFNYLHPDYDQLRTDILQGNLPIRISRKMNDRRTKTDKNVEEQRDLDCVSDALLDRNLRVFGTCCKAEELLYRWTNGLYPLSNFCGINQPWNVAVISSSSEGDGNGDIDDGAECMEVWHAHTKATLNGEAHGTGTTAYSKQSFTPRERKVIHCLARRYGCTSETIETVETATSTMWNGPTVTETIKRIRIFKQRRPLSSSEEELRRAATTSSGEKRFEPYYNYKFSDANLELMEELHRCTNNRLTDANILRTIFEFADDTLDEPSVVVKCNLQQYRCENFKRLCPYPFDF